ncbi:membrane protein implicated in regulation of membrane protease activity [Aequitasia blattaphilus]|uniref:Uncharacterized protein n=1 Tax=Aequitasia blattaphilus TaxID=2949332 RepID=A0ABT1EAU5_9FIRM|nr:hypothetical protein [Aequitasia blattaphilus]MCP1102955.1 hypothetical protein [Aequitasia blattaphilus]MCR8615595.1 hypothetical protein [Aequitasia blattaphilus]
MSNTFYKMLGLFCLILSIFFLLGALFLGPAVVPAFVPILCWVVGLLLLMAGIFFYQIFKK